MMLFSALAKQLFGAKYEGLKKSIMIAIIVFAGVYFAEFKMDIAPVVLYLVSVTFPFGIMWQALCSKQNANNLKGILVLPFSQKDFICSYVTTMSMYVLVNKSSVVLALFFAVGTWRPIHIVVSLLCAMIGCLIAMMLYACKGSEKREILKGLLLKDAYAFYQPVQLNSKYQSRKVSGDMFIYIMRYLCTNKNFLINTVGLCGVAIILPMMMQEFEGMQIMPIGFGILSINTPLCILLSVDRDLQRAVKMLPGQGGLFCVKYGCFLTTVNLFINLLYAMSWRIQCGSIDTFMIVIAVVFAPISAILSVVMEWYFPLQDWKLESDLYHHPRKYIVPGVMMLLAGFVMFLAA